MTTPIKFTTNDWKLHAFLEWRERRSVEKCSHCNGNLVVGGHFGDLDGEKECPTCLGRGYVTSIPTTPAPEIPKDLIEHMRAAWDEYKEKHGIKDTD